MPLASATPLTLSPQAMANALAGLPALPTGSLLLPATVERPLLDAFRDEVRGGPRVCALSGGIDSGALAAVLAAGDEPAFAYTVDDGSGDEELRRAEALARHTGARQVLIPVRDDMLPQAFIATVEASRNLVFNARAIERFLFFRGLSAKGVKAIQSGTGADELLMGQPRARLSRPSPLGQSLLRSELRSVPAPEPACPGSLREAILQIQLPSLTLPAEVGAAKAHGIALHLPYLGAAFAAQALRRTEAELVRGNVGKVAWRAALEGVLPPEFLSLPKSARYAPAVPRERAAELAFRDLLSDLCSGPRLARLGILHGNADALLTRYGMTSPDADDVSATLLRLASLVVLTGA